MVWFAEPIGLSLVKERSASGSGGWNLNKAREAALTLRFLGAMFFFAGLVERLAIPLSALKR